MKDENRNQSQAIRRRKFAAAALFSSLLLLPSSFLQADSIWLDKSDGPPMFANVKISNVEKGSIIFLVSGNEVRRELARIARISIDDEPALNAAEDAFAAQNWDVAVDGYEKVARGSSKVWLRDWATARLVSAAEKSGRFDSAVDAYITLLVRDPASADAKKPALPAAGSTFLDSAVTQVNQALAGKQLADAPRAALLSFLVEIHSARKDEPAANSAAEKLDEVLARDPSNPAAARANVRRKIQSATKLVTAGQFKQAADEIEKNRVVFVEPAQQAEALYLLAEARYGLARESGDKKQLADAALAYMRVVANFAEVPGQPRVAASLAQSAAICEKVGDTDGALKLYDSLVTQFAADPSAAAARASADRLRSTPRN